MADNYLFEAFSALNILEEEAFDVTAEGVAELDTFVSDDADMDFETIIDPLAETEEELQDTYIGKAILDCVVCQSKIYKDPEEVVINEEEDMANVGEICPYCQSSDGYKIIGQVAAYKPEEETEVEAETTEEVEVEIEDKEEEKDEEEIDEALKTPEGLKKLNKKAVKEDYEEDEENLSLKAQMAKHAQPDPLEEQEEEKLEEDLENVKVETDKEIITVTSEPKADIEEVAESSEEMIAPLTDEVEAEFQNETEEEEEEPGYEDIEFDEFEETDFDNLGEKYLTRVYENVQSFKTTSGKVKGNTLTLEGVITFKSGKEAKTSFVFEAKTKDANNSLKFVGENKHLAKGSKAFTIVGKAEGSKLMFESLTYNYRGKDTTTGKSQRLYGTVLNRRK